MIAPHELKELMQDAGLDRYQAADFLCRNERQIRRWMHRGAPEWVGRMLRMRSGRLDEFGWRRWRIHKGRLYCELLKEGFAPGDLFAWWWLRQRQFRYDSKGPSVHNETGGKQMSE